MKKKVLYIGIIAVIIITVAVVFGYLLDYANSNWSYLSAIQNDDLLSEVLNSTMIEEHKRIAIQYTVLCILAGIALCGSIALLIIVLKSDISFIKNSVAEKLKATRAQREEERAQRNEERKAAKIAALEEELDRLKKDGE